MKQGTYFKGARPDGWDFYSGKTINYRENIGKIVKVPHHYGEERPVPPNTFRLCSSDVLHASREPVGVFIGSKIPLSLYRVTGTPVVEDSETSGFTEFLIEEEIPESRFDELFGFRYGEVIHPLDPRKIQFASEVSKEELDTLKIWVSVRDSVWDSVRDSVRVSVWVSVWDSVWDSMLDSVRDSVWDSMLDSVRDSVWVSVWVSVRDSMLDSMAAYVGSLFPRIKNWKYTGKLEVKGYPFQSCVELLKLGLVPCTDGEKWYLTHPKVDEKAEIAWSGEV